MNKLKWWFRIVGALYFLMGIRFIPALNAARLPFMLPGFDALAGGVIYRGLLDFSCSAESSQKIKASFTPRSGR